MQELLIDPESGFCPGVKKAIQGALSYAAQNPPAYSLGELIHNPVVLEELRRAGIRSIEDVSALPPGGHLIIRAHGLPPETEQNLQQHKIPYLDLTCAIVKKVQNLVAGYAKRGYKILIVGKPGHPELTGLLGYAASQGKVVPDLSTATAVRPESRMVLLAQTTTSQGLFQQISHFLASHNPDLQIEDTICHFVLRRQQWLGTTAPLCDAALIVGGKQSSNTAQLYKIATAVCPAYWIESASELTGLDLAGYKKVALSAGTSTPPEEITAVVNHLRRQYSLE